MYYTPRICHYNSFDARGFAADIDTWICDVTEQALPKGVELGLRSSKQASTAPLVSHLIVLVVTVIHVAHNHPFSSYFRTPSYNRNTRRIMLSSRRFLSVFTLLASAFVRAQDQIILNSGHNLTAIGGTWASGTQQVVTGSVRCFEVCLLSLAECGTCD